VLAIITALIFCVAIPFLIMAMLTRSLERTAPHYPNYRGVSVYNGLGVVWFIWLLALWGGAHLLVVSQISQPNWVSYLVPIFPLVAGSCIFGLFDDWVGDHNAKGFRGHIGSLLKGILTTGGVKMLAIGTLALITMVSLYWGSMEGLVRIIAGTCVIALSANLINLFDLRPGRAGKIYTVSLVVCTLLVAFGGVIHMNWPDLVALALVGLGPILAVLRYDLGEKGMLGDAGANSMGAFLGYLLATALPLWALIAWAVVLFALNLSGEYVSFSKIIEGNRFLRKLDGLGRKDVKELSSKASPNRSSREPQEQNSKKSPAGSSKDVNLPSNKDVVE
jgi:hypothetical protein